MSGLAEALVLLLSITAYGLTVAMFIWLRKFRLSVLRALSETAEQQVNTSQLVSEALTKLQRQQRIQEQSLRKLAEAHMGLRHDLGTVSARLENNERRIQHPPEPRILH